MAKYFDFENCDLNPGEYVYIGYQSGTFVAEDGRSVPYKNIFVLNNQISSTNRAIYGFVSQKLKITSTDICKDLVPGSIVSLYFDQYGRVQQVIPC